MQLKMYYPMKNFLILFFITAFVSVDFGNKIKAYKNIETKQQTDYTITVSVSPENSGTVTGDGVYAEGDQATLTAIPENGYEFVNWTEDGTEVSNSTDYSFTVTSDRTLVANFRLKTYQINTYAQPVDGGSVTGAGTYSFDEIATVSATANTGYEFINWTENGTEVSQQQDYSFSVNADRELTANFNPLVYDITASVYPENTGTIEGVGQYLYGQTVTLTATAAQGYEFVNWTENDVEISTDATYSFPAEENRNLTANFNVLSYTISVSANPSDMGTTEGGGTFEYGETVSVKTKANEGYKFINWTENNDEVSTDTVYVFTVERNRDLVVNFSSVTGFEKFEKYRFKIYPNPVQSLLYIECTDEFIYHKPDIRLYITDNTGKQSELNIFEFGQNKITINLSDKSQGYYSITMYIRGKLIKSFNVFIK
jgi:hypothetical protein